MMKYLGLAAMLMTILLTLRSTAGRAPTNEPRRPGLGREAICRSAHGQTPR